MIDLNGNNAKWDWDMDIKDGETQCPEVYSSTSQRISSILDTSGEPLMVGYERNSIGFDLRTKR